MPTILRDGPYRFFFYASDRAEPRHVHVQRDRPKAKFWLEPVELSINKGFVHHELRRVENLVVRHQQTLIREWNDYFDA